MLEQQTWFLISLLTGQPRFIQVFPEFYKVDNIANDGLHGEEQNKFSYKIFPSGNWIQDFLIQNQ